MSRQGALEDERGFTLGELLITIVIMGIVFAIASSSWFGALESRRVDSATNQLVADLRLVHSKATNRLEDWRVDMDADTRNYRTYRKDPLTGNFALVSSSSLPERTEFLPTMSVPTAIVFYSAGGAQITGAGGIKIAADDGSPCRVIKVNSVTSRVQVSTSAC